ncbi:MAG TPA: aminotransferase class V-fold PLP-dependent enzyme [Actinomycetota bacterium]|nr:aminotransferase class V-fold PLP-dependent enzyme [Actinomycetota bacterium]
MTAAPIDVERVRAETPGCEKRIHFNNAGASLMPRPVVDAVRDHLELETVIGGYEAAEAESDRIDAVYQAAARLVNCRADEIALMENATRAWQAVFYGNQFRRGDRILTARAEYSSNFMAYLHVAQGHGVEIVVVEDDEHGQIDVDRLASSIDGRTRLISMSHIPTSGGLVNPAERVGQVARAAGVPFLLDACQSVGQMPIDVEAIGCDFLSTTGRKFIRAPRGTGFLYVSQERLEDLHPPWVEIGSGDWSSRDGYTLKPNARRFETWEVSYALQLGLGRALEYATEISVPAIWSRVSELAAALREQLAGIPGVTVHDLGEVRCGIVTFSAGGIGADEIREALARAGINVYVSKVDNTRLDLERRGLDRIVRASVHYFNTQDEIDEAVGAVKRVVSGRG